MQKTIPFAQPQQDPLGFVREGFVTLNPAQARYIVEHCRYDRQRDETRALSHIAALAEQMRRGLWLPKTQIDFARLDGRLILVNGHHRLTAQAQTGDDIVWSVVIHDCETEAELRALYPRFDTVLRKRTTANILKGIDFADGAGLMPTTASALWAAAPIIASGLQMNTGKPVVLLPDDQQAVAASYASEALVAEGYLDHAPKAIRQKLRTGGRFAIMLVTIKHRPMIAQEFWVGLCEDDGLAKGDPRKTLLNDMMTRSTQGLLSGPMMACARAWNTFYRGDRATILRVNGNAIPLSGTPFTVRA